MAHRCYIVGYLIISHVYLLQKLLLVSYLTICGYYQSRVKGTSNLHDFTLAAQACIPIISALLAEIKNQRYPQKCFLNIDVPSNVTNHKVQGLAVCLAYKIISNMT